MSAEYETLLSVKSVIDHDCGNYQIGEIDFALYGTLDQYLEEYGLEGRNRIVVVLGFLQSQVFRIYENIAEKNQPPTCAK